MEEVTATATASLDVDVRDPTEIKSGRFSRAYTVYHVVTSANSWDVVRRFSDFEWLHSALAARFVGLLLPPLPEKRMFGNAGQAFVEQRCRDLRSFIGRITRNKYLQSSLIVRDFLSFGSDLWEQRKTDGDDGKHDEAVETWFTDTLSLSLPDGDPSLILEPLVRQFEFMEKSFASMVEATRKQVQRAHDLGEGNAEVGVALGGIRDSVVTGLPESMEFTSKQFDGLREAFDIAAQANAEWMKLSGFLPSELEMVILTSSADQLAEMASFRGLLTSRAAIDATFKKVSQLKDKHGYELRRLKAKSAPEDKITKMEQAVEEVRRVFGVKLTLGQDEIALQAAKRDLDVSTLALLNTELPRLAQECKERFRNAFVEFAALQIATASKMKIMWEKELAAFEVDMETAAEMASLTLSAKVDL